MARHAYSNGPSLLVAESVRLLRLEGECAGDETI